MLDRPNQDKPSIPLTNEENERFFDTINGGIRMDEQLDMTAVAVESEFPLLEGYAEEIVDSSRTYDEKMEDLVQLALKHMEYDEEEDEFFGDDKDRGRGSWVDSGIESGFPLAFHVRGIEYAGWRARFSRLGRGLVRAMDGFRTPEHRSDV